MIILDFLPDPDEIERARREVVDNPRVLEASLYPPERHSPKQRELVASGKVWTEDLNWFYFQMPERYCVGDVDVMAMLIRYGTQQPNNLYTTEPLIYFTKHLLYLARNITQQRLITEMLPNGTNLFSAMFDQKGRILVFDDETRRGAFTTPHELREAVLSFAQRVHSYLLTEIPELSRYPVMQGWFDSLV